MQTDKILKLQKLIDESSRIVFFGGAGVSTESDIPDFRSATGLYSQKLEYIRRRNPQPQIFYGKY
jgi:NAD-dependent deacetylase